LSQTETAAVITSGNVLNNLVSESSLIIREFFRAAMGSPILAATAALIVEDLMEKKFGLISSDAGLAIKASIATLIGADIAASIADAVPFSGKGTNPLVPGALSVSNNDGKENKTQVQNIPVNSEAQ
jgi:uncharacterized protein (DUF697 family)